MRKAAAPSNMRAMMKEKNEEKVENPVAGDEKV